MKKLAIITTHPIQYYAPVFKLLAKTHELKVFYTWGKSVVEDKFDPDFGKIITWDIPLLEGYEYEFLENISPNPGSGHFRGIQNPLIIERIVAFHPSAILVYGWAYQSHLKVIRHFKGRIPIWFRGDSNLLDKTPFYKKILRSFLLKWVYSYIDKAFYVGTANKAYYKAFGLKESQLVFAPHAIDNERFAKDRTNEALTLRSDLGISTSAKLILFAGKLESKKNPELLLKAFLEINYPNVYLLFVGNGLLEESLKRSTVGHHNSKSQPQTPDSKLIFLPFQNQSQMPVIYQACDIFCLPSNGPGETWGLAVNEAMAAAKAILISDRVGSAADLIRNNGMIFKANDLTDLKMKLKKILTANLKVYGVNSKELINLWSFNKQVKAIESELIKIE